jgi:hypothetical protein
MAKKKTPKKIVKKKAAPKAASGAKTKVRGVVKASAKTTPVPKKPKDLAGPVRAMGIAVYIDSCFFFPPQSSSGYIENFQEGRNTVISAHSLMAALPLPVGAVIKTITVYYKNTSKEDMQVLILKKHIDHHAFSGEVEVSLDFLPPAAVPPDDFAAKVIDHFDAGGLIKDKYLYYIEIANTTKTADEVRTVRGMRLEYTV